MVRRREVCNRKVSYSLAQTQVRFLPRPLTMHPLTLIIEHIGKTSGNAGVLKIFTNKIQILTDNIIK